MVLMPRVLMGTCARIVEPDHPGNDNRAKAVTGWVDGTTLGPVPWKSGWLSRLSRRAALVLALSPIAPPSAAEATSLTSSAQQELRITWDQTRPAGWIGISVNVLRSPDGDEAGRVALITAVDPRGPAAKAGVEAGKRIFALNGIEQIETYADLRSRLLLAVGDTVWLVVGDDRNRREFRLVAEQRPQTYMGEQALPAGESIDSLADAVYAMVVSAIRPFSVRDTSTTGRATDVVDNFLESMTTALASLSPSVSEFDSLRMLMASSSELLTSMVSPLTLSTTLTVTEADSEGVAFGPLTPYVLGRDRVAGAELSGIGPGLGSYFDVKYGVLVLAAPRGTPAWRVGLRVGDVITAVGDLPIRSVPALRLLLRRRAWEPTTFTVVRAGKTIEVTLSK